MPEIEEALREKGAEVVRPEYGNGEGDGQGKEEEDGEEAKGMKEAEEEEANTKEARKKNFEETSEEGE